jgi:hypothetical protein
VNADAKVALKVLELAQTLQPAVTSSMGFVKMMCRVLQRLGDYEQLRWFFGSVLEPGLGGKDSSTDLSLRDAAELWEEYFRIEASLGLLPPARMSGLRLRRNEARHKYEDSQRSKPQELFADSSRDLTSGVVQLLERFDFLEASEMSTLDGSVRTRCLRLTDSTYVRGVWGEAESEAADTGRRRPGGRREDVQDGSLAHVSGPVRELVARLPVQSAGVDVGVFLEHLRRLVLPARPSEEGGDGGGGRRDGVGQHFKRELEEDTDREDPEEDVFNQRQRMRLSGALLI